ncbi:MAG: hypothetical protein Q8R92_13030 [Deltaproteobacteria bacterium]|nr:hypothetical protein [Deltaproteobacteria bacterium]
MNPLVKNILMGVAESIAGKLEGASEVLRDEAIPLLDRLAYAESAINSLSSSLPGKAGDVFRALSGLLHEAQDQIEKPTVTVHRE